MQKVIRILQDSYKKLVNLMTSSNYLSLLGQFHKILIRIPVRFIRNCPKFLIRKNVIQESDKRTRIMLQFVIKLSCKLAYKECKVKCKAVLLSILQIVYKCCTYVVHMCSQVVASSTPAVLAVELHRAKLS